MNTLKKILLMTLGITLFGFLLFSFATIGLTILGIACVLVITAYLARPLLPKVSGKPCIIDMEVVAPSSR